MLLIVAIFRKNGHVLWLYYKYTNCSIAYLLQVFKLVLFVGNMGVYPEDTRWGVSKVNNPISCFVYTKHKKKKT